MKKSSAITDFPAPVCILLKELKDDMDSGDWTIANIKWLETLCGFKVGRKGKKVNWNVHGSEYQMIVQHLSSMQV